ncbi:hypothetical protein BS78_06G015400 [Paspalum vaginatum]|nr:hypothetical protein BS78_06G015400 [Paspalum vaginatum]
MEGRFSCLCQSLFAAAAAICISATMANARLVLAIQVWTTNLRQFSMVFFPINIKRCHWYLGLVNARECEIHVLDSCGDASATRIDLAAMVIGPPKTNIHCD